MSAQTINTTCPYCGVGCGLEATVSADGTVAVRGDKEHPANFGRLCSKGSALAETLDLDGRLLHPQVNGQRCDWDEALTYVAEGFNRIIAEHGPDAVAFYVSGQLLTEDYYVANKLMKGFIGSANIDTNSRLCMASSVAGHRRGFGADAVPCSYEDLEQAELVVLVGSNTAWCHPVLFQRISAAKKANDKLRIVVIDPRRTPTCEIADLHLALRPGTDVHLFNGLLGFLEANGYRDETFVTTHTEGVDAALSAARAEQSATTDVAGECGVAPAQLEAFYQLFASNERVVTVYSQGVNQSSAGTDKVNSIINCHLLTGRIGRPGMGPFSFTGQPNAMGGREVGGLANQLAAHMSIASDLDRERVQRFWGAPAIANHEGLKAVDLFRAIGEGRVKAVWIMGTNPAVSLPGAEQVREALAECELVVVSDCVRDTDTNEFAHILLPAAAWGEKDGTVTNSERRISRQRRFLPFAGEAKPDWWIVTQVARRMNFADAFKYESATEIFREHAALSGFENEGDRAFDIGALASVSDTEYETMVPLQWPVRGGASIGTERLFANGRFFTASRKARFVPTAARLPVNAPTHEYPLILNTGRIRDQWHTMTRTAKTPRLMAHQSEPLVSVNSHDAQTYGLADGALAEVQSRWGSFVGRVSVTDTQSVGSVFVPMHWNDQYSARARASSVVNPVVDPISGEPEFKHTPVRIAPHPVGWYAFILSREPLQLPEWDYWTRIKGESHWRYEFAGREVPADWARYIRDLLADVDRELDWIEYADCSAQRYRTAALSGDRLEACAFVGSDPVLPPREWLGGLFKKDALCVAERASVLVGMPANAQDKGGPTVCSCFKVGRATILNAVVEHGCTSVEAVGERLGAGTNCGSCVPEIQALIDEQAVRLREAS